LLARIASRGVVAVDDDDDVDDGDDGVDTSTDL